MVQLVFCVILFSLICTMSFAQAPATQPAKPKVLFIGSSSIEQWETLKQDFPEADVIQRGTGGRLLEDIAKSVAQDVLPDRPAKVFLYAGSIDVHSDRSPEQTRDAFIAFCNAVHAELPETTVYFLSCKASLAKWKDIAADRELNFLIEHYGAQTLKVVYIDLFMPMLGRNGIPHAEYFVADRNHLSPMGYKLWADIVRPYLTGEKVEEPDGRDRREDNE